MIFQQKVTVTWRHALGWFGFLGHCKRFPSSWGCYSSQDAQEWGFNSWITGWEQNYQSNSDQNWSTPLVGSNDSGPSLTFIVITVVNGLTNSCWLPRAWLIQLSSSFRLILTSPWPLLYLFSFTPYFATTLMLAARFGIETGPVSIEFYHLKLNLSFTSYLEPKVCVKTGPVWSYRELL